jgi:hypothetical protein
LGGKPLIEPTPAIAEKARSQKWHFCPDLKSLPTLLDLGFGRFRVLRFKKVLNFVRISGQSLDTEIGFITDDEESEDDFDDSKYVLEFSKICEPVLTEPFGVRKSFD